MGDAAGRRLDEELVVRGLATTRSQARAAIERGEVTVDGASARKTAQRVRPNAAVTAVAERYVSRGGYKLETALEGLRWDVAGARAIDVGASTGGFTDCLLTHGAARVVALDVGHGQLHERLRRDARVAVVEGRNARDLVAADLPFVPDLAVVDVSFISLRLVLRPLFAVLGAPWRAILLVKPQFEAGPDTRDRDGVVRDPGARARAVAEVARYAASLGAVPIAVLDSEHPGTAGNREYLLAVTSSDHPFASDAADLADLAARAEAPTA